MHLSIIMSQEMSAQEARKILLIDRTKNCFAFPTNAFPAFLISVMKKPIAKELCGICLSFILKL